VEGTFTYDWDFSFLLAYKDAFFDGALLTLYIGSADFSKNQSLSTDIHIIMLISSIFKTR